MIEQLLKQLDSKQATINQLRQRVAQLQGIRNTEDLIIYLLMSESIEPMSGGIMNSCSNVSGPGALPMLRWLGSKGDMGPDELCMP